MHECGDSAGKWCLCVFVCLSMCFPVWSDYHKHNGLCLCGNIITVGLCMGHCPGIYIKLACNGNMHQ